MKKCVSLAVALWTMSASMPLSAQTSLATITGTVQDQQGTGIPNVKVVVTNIATKPTYARNSGDDGTYLIVPATLGGGPAFVKKAS